MFLFESVEFDLVGFMLRLLLQTTDPRCVFVLLSQGSGSRRGGQFTLWTHGVDEARQLAQFSSGLVQLRRIRRHVVAVAASSLATVTVARRRRHLQSQTLSYLLAISDLSSKF